MLLFTSNQLMLSGGKFSSLVQRDWRLIGGKSTFEKGNNKTTRKPLTAQPKQPKVKTDADEKNFLKPFN